MEEITFKKSDCKDIPKLIELRKLQLLEEGSDVTCDITAPLSDYYEKHLADSSFISWAAAVNNEIIAVSGMSFVEKPPYYGNPTGRIGLLSSMYTVPLYRRKGIAKKLLDLAVNEAKERGCGAVQLTASNMGAYLYKDFGFERNNNFFQYKII